MTLTNLTAYDKALSAAAYYRLPQAGYLQIRGDDRVDYLQRQTTNDLRTLQPERALLTVLTSPIARVLDVFCLVAEDDIIGAISLPSMAEATTSFLQSRIFFMDKVSVENASAAYAQFEVMGPHGERSLSVLGFTGPYDVNRVYKTEWHHHQVALIPMGPPFGLGFRILAPVEVVPQLERALSEYGCASLEEASYEALRIEAGLPKVGAELRQDFTPLETGLMAAVSDNKGCYTGQEVIARQITYDKVTQTLCGLRLQSEVAPGMRLWVDAKPVGELTSFVKSPRYGWIGLGIVKRPNNQTGSMLKVGSSPHADITAQIVTLPFVDD